MKRIHYIAMGGEYGSLPDNCGAYKKRKDAINSMISLYELSRRQATELRKYGTVALKRTQGGAYCEVSECDCAEPWEHDEFGDRNEWEEYIIPEPKEGDYMITSNGFESTLSVVNGSTLLRGIARVPLTEKQIVHFIRARMDKERYWPNVWHCNDHGSIDLLRLYKHCYRMVTK